MSGGTGSPSQTKRATTEISEIRKIARDMVETKMKMHVLLVESEGSRREQHRLVITTSGNSLMTVHTTKDGAGAVSLHQSGETFKAIFIDLDLPDAIEAVRALRNMKVGTRIVGMVEADDPNLVRRFKSAGGNELLRLPLWAKDVTPIVVRAWGARSTDRIPPKPY